MSNKKGALLTEEQRLEKALTKKKRQEDRTENFYRLFSYFGAVCGDHYHDFRNRCSV